MKNSKLNLEIKNWISGNKNRKIKYTWFKSEYLGMVGLVLFVENGITVNFISYSLVDIPFFLRRLYACASIHLDNTTKANAIMSGIEELNQKDFTDNNIAIARKCGELLNKLLQQ